MAILEAGVVQACGPVGRKAGIAKASAGSDYSKFIADGQTR